MDDNEWENGFFRRLGYRQCGVASASSTVLLTVGITERLLHDFYRF